MNYSFRKYQGTGNDFILIDDRRNEFDVHAHAFIEQLCDRRFGIGADGLMLLREKAGYDFEMIYFNADGQLGSMCGNGGRCITRFAADLGVVTKQDVRFLAVDGPHEASLSDALVRLKMIDVPSIETNPDFYFLNTGSPHVVQFVDADPDVVAAGRAIRYNERFAAAGTNVNFAQVKDDHVFVRTYERGVEDETYSCGTGVTAVALVCARVGKSTASTSCAIHTRGGNLTIYFKAQGEGFTDIWLEGPAQFVYSGEINS